jgi:hypothetical protein
MTRALYCHSSLPDDLGIQYQSYSQNAVVAQDDFVSILPGLGHTGNEPFDDHHGWYRSYRGLAGTIKYHAKWKGWNCNEHYQFSTPLKDAVMTMLLAEKRSPTDPNRILAGSLRSPQGSRKKACLEISRKSEYYLSSLPKYVIFHILEFMVSVLSILVSWCFCFNISFLQNYDWFKEIDESFAVPSTVPSSPVVAQSRKVLCLLSVFSSFLYVFCRPYHEACFNPSVKFIHIIF